MNLALSTTPAMAASISARSGASGVDVSKSGTGIAPLGYDVTIRLLRRGVFGVTAQLGRARAVLPLAHAERIPTDDHDRAARAAARRAAQPGPARRPARARGLREHAGLDR